MLQEKILQQAGFVSCSLISQLFILNIGNGRVGIACKGVFGLLLADIAVEIESIISIIANRLKVGTIIEEPGKLGYFRI